MCMACSKWWLWLSAIPTDAERDAVQTMTAGGRIAVKLWNESKRNLPRISAKIPAILTDIYCGFLESFEANHDIILWISP